MSNNETANKNGKYNGKIGETVRTNKESKKNHWIRVTAAILIVALLITGLFSRLVQVSISAQTVADAASAAGNYLVDNTEYVNMNPIDRAKAVLRNALSNYGDEFNKHYEAASIAIGQEEYEEALEEITACLELIDESNDKYLDLVIKKGCLEALLGKYDEAIESFRLALSIDDSAAQAHLLIAELLLEKNDILGATDHLTRYAELTPEDSSQLPVIAELQYGQSNYAKAIEYGEKAIAKGCDADMDLYNSIALSYLLQGDYEKARKYLDKAVESGEAAKTAAGGAEPAYAISPLSETYYYRGLSKLTLGSFSEAKADYDKSIELGYATSLVYYNRGVCELQEEDYQACYDDMKIVVEIGDEEELVTIAQTIVDAIDSAIEEAQASASQAASAAQATAIPEGEILTDVPQAVLPQPEAQTVLPQEEPQAVLPQPESQAILPPAEPQAGIVTQ